MSRYRDNSHTNEAALNRVLVSSSLVSASALYNLIIPRHNPLDADGAPASRVLLRSQLETHIENACGAHSFRPALIFASQPKYVTIAVFGESYVSIRSPSNYSLGAVASECINVLRVRFCYWSERIYRDALRRDVGALQVRQCHDLNAGAAVCHDKAVTACDRPIEFVMVVLREVCFGEVWITGDELRSRSRVDLVLELFEGQTAVRAIATLSLRLDVVGLLPHDCALCELLRLQQQRLSVGLSTRYGGMTAGEWRVGRVEEDSSEYTKYLLADARSTQVPEQGRSRTM